MTRNPLEGLSEHLLLFIDGLCEYHRKEGYAQAVHDLSAGKPEAPITKDDKGSGAKPKGRRRKGSRTSGLPPAARGSAPQLVEEHYRLIAPKPARPNQIVNAVADRHKVKLALTPVRRAILALTEKGVLEKMGDQNMWRLAETAAPALRAVS